MNLAGSDGVASLTIIWYAQELFSGMFRGYITGVSSVVSYNLGKATRNASPAPSASASGPSPWPVWPWWR